MKLLVTGTPGTGKTVISKALSKHFKLEVLNEKEFALKKGIGEWDNEENELVVPVKKLEIELNKLLSKKKNIVLEGHLLCETKLKIDFAILLRADPEILEGILSKRNYSAVKIQDNVFAEGIDYCKKHLIRKYPRKKIIEIQNSRNIKDTTDKIINEIKIKAKK